MRACGWVGGGVAGMFAFFVRACGCGRLFVRFHNERRSYVKFVFLLLNKQNTKRAVKQNTRRRRRRKKKLRKITEKIKSHLEHLRKR